MSICRRCTWFTGSGCIANIPYGTEPLPVGPEDPCCGRFEVVSSCDPCGACCREAFDAVPADGGGLPEELTEPLHELFTSVKRVPGMFGGTRCACLRGDGESAPFRCTHYAVRPTACRELERGSENCLLARRRVRLSPPPPRR
ncbi:MAG: YkgJ family cysteine cluster protein [Myxococcales bacterium]|nr:YkgJ family cysteine cluster protein [Myxococcales bacterium]MCA9567193.1 YkgJ family cysteine cluster protein [Myxococcales bacterium]MCB9691815.1 YkgJ family cysteine cluster protein [Alphaproteobacteria bacterium]